MAREFSARFSGWWLAVAGGLILMLMGDTSGLQEVGRALMAAVVTSEGRVFEIPGAVGIAVLVVGLACVPLIGAAADRWGPRPLLVAAFTAMGVAFLLALGAQYRAVHGVAYGMLVLGGLLGSPVVVATLVNRWFRRRRATAMGLALAPLWFGNLAFEVVDALGGLFFGGTARPVMIGLAALMFALAWPVWRLVVNSPEERGQRPDGTGSVGDVVLAGGGPGISAALGSIRLWQIVLAMVCAAVLADQVEVVGFGLLESAEVSTTLLGGIGPLRRLVAIPSLVLMGMVGDRFPIQRVMAACFAMEILAVAALPMLSTTWAVLVAGVLMGIGSGGLAGLFLAALGNYFGQRHYGVLLGLANIVTWTLDITAATVGAAFVVALFSWTVAVGVLGFIGVLGMAAVALLGAAGRSGRSSSEAVNA